MAITKRRLKKGKIKFLSLCPRGANTLETIFKADSDEFDLTLLAKDLTEAGELLAVVYAPELRDSQGDIASAEVVKDLLYTAARDGMELDIRHDGKALPRESAYVAEQFLIQKGDPRFADFKDYDGQSVDVTGAWGVVLKIDDPNLRKLYREGAWNGVSMGGTAVFENTDKSEQIAARLAEKLANKPTGDREMTKEEMGELSAMVATAVAKAMTPEAPEAPKPEDTAVFKGDPTDPKAVAAHCASLQKAALLKSVDWADPEAVAAYSATLAKTAETSGDEAKDEEIKKLQERLTKLQGASAQGAPSDTTKPENLTKEQTEFKRLFLAGKASGLAHNKIHGYA